MCVWGGAIGVKRLVFLGTDHVRSESYVSTLSKVFTKLKMKGRWFMPDGAPAQGYGYSVAFRRGYLHGSQVSGAFDKCFNN